VFRGAAHDVGGLRNESPPPGDEPLLVPVMRQGRRLGPSEPIAETAQRCAASLARLPPGSQELRAPEQVSVKISAQLEQLQHRLEHQLRREGPGEAA
jgi:nicotinate phosphoribosyltransferase